MTYQGKDIAVYSLHSEGGMQADITNFGARIMRLLVPDRNDELRDVVQGFDNVEDYFPDNHLSDFGAVIGRYANRLCNGRITIDDVTYQLPQNNGNHCLHGGPRGWQYSVYDVLESTEQKLVLQMTSPDGDNGFPGEVKVRVTYTLSNDNALKIEYHAETDKATVINMTNHSYFNLNGDQGSSAMNHKLSIDADFFTPTDDTNIPLGQHSSVENTPMDFRISKIIGRDIDNEQLCVRHGYDYNFVLNTRGCLSRPCAVLSSPESGIVLNIYSTAPGLQLYTGNFLDGVSGKQGICYPRHSAICLETQQYPDSPNHQWQESTGFLHPEKPFDSTTILSFY